MRKYLLRRGVGTARWQICCEASRVNRVRSLFAVVRGERCVGTRGWLGIGETAAAGSKTVGGAGDAEGAAFHDVRIDHRGTNVAVAEEFLDGADVGAVFEQVGGE
jgi:hypothetical protein